MRIKQVLIAIDQVFNAMLGGDLVKISLKMLLVQSSRLSAEVYEYYQSGGGVEIIEAQAALFYNPLAAVTNTTIPGEI